MESCLCPYCTVLRVCQTLLLATSPVLSAFLKAERSYRDKFEHQGEGLTIVPLKSLNFFCLFASYEILPRVACSLTMCIMS
jgi:hypothetical protein